MFGSLASRLFGGGRNSKSAAKSRLSFVLVQDRTGLSSEEMASFRGELVEVIQRYFVIDEQGFDIDYERSGDTTTLVINSPVVVRRNGGNSRNGSAKNGNLKGVHTASNARVTNADKPDGVLFSEQKSEPLIANSTGSSVDSSTSRNGGGSSSNSSHASRKRRRIR